MNKAISCAAEPASLARLASSCFSVEVWSTAASMAVLNNSVISEINDATTSTILMAGPKSRNNAKTIKIRFNQKNLAKMRFHNDTRQPVRLWNNQTH